MTTVPITSLRTHRLLVHLPALPTDSTEYRNLAADVAARGIDQPLIVCRTEDGAEDEGSYYVLDGRHRHAAALDAGLATVPVIIRDEADAEGIVLGALVQRRHYTKSALVYAVWPWFAPRTHRKGGDRRSKKSNPNDSGLIPMGEIADRLGVSEDLVTFAKQAHELFAERPDLRAKFEPAILAGELALNRLPGAVAGRDSTIGRERATPEPQQLLFQGFDLLKTRFGRWEKIAESERTALSAEWVRTVYDLPEDVQRRTYESLAAKFQ